MDNFNSKRKPPRAYYHQIDAVNKDEWYTKEEDGKSMKNALRMLWYTNKHLSGCKQ